MHIRHDLKAGQRLAAFQKLFVPLFQCSDCSHSCSRCHSLQSTLRLPYLFCHRINSVLWIFRAGFYRRQLLRHLVNDGRSTFCLINGFYGCIRKHLIINPKLIHQAAAHAITASAVTSQDKIKLRIHSFSTVSRHGDGGILLPIHVNSHASITVKRADYVMPLVIIRGYLLDLDPLSGYSGKIHAHIRIVAVIVISKCPSYVAAA